MTLDQASDEINAQLDGVDERIDDDPIDDDGIVVMPWWHNPINLIAIAIAIAVLAAALGWMVGNNAAIDNPNDTDTGFLQDMRWHHDQAVQMGLMYLELPDTQPGLRTVARTIIVGQSQETGRMIEMLKDFGAAEYNGTDIGMQWMGAPTPIDSMPGMASTADLERFAASSGAEADQIFVTLMTAHHEGGIHMAEFAAENAGTDQVRLMAAQIADSQADEIRELEAEINR